MPLFWEMSNWDTTATSTGTWPAQGQWTGYKTWEPEPEALWTNARERAEWHLCQLLPMWWDTPVAVPGGERGVRPLIVFRLALRGKPSPLRKRARERRL